MWFVLARVILFVAHPRVCSRTVHLYAGLQLVRQPADVRGVRHFVAGPSLRCSALMPAPVGL